MVTGWSPGVGVAALHREMPGGPHNPARGWAVAQTGMEDHAATRYGRMVQCTAPASGHRTAGGAADCPACSGRSSYSSSYYQPTPPVIRSALQAQRFPSFASRSSGVDKGSGAALELNALLTALEVSVWFREMDVPLGTLLIRKIDKGLASSRAGGVLATPALFSSLNNEGIAAQELSALLATDRVIPIVHGTTFDSLRQVSPLLAARSGPNTADYASLDEVATRIADTVMLD